MRERRTTVSTKGNVSGCSSIKPPATLSIIPSSIYTIALEVNVAGKEHPLFKYTVIFTRLSMTSSGISWKYTCT